jgi:hypothetical protein
VTLNCFYRLGEDFPERRHLSAAGRQTLRSCRNGATLFAYSFCRDGNQQRHKSGCKVMGNIFIFLIYFFLMPQNFLFRFIERATWTVFNIGFASQCSNEGLEKCAKDLIISISEKHPFVLTMVVDQFAEKDFLDACGNVRQKFVIFGRYLCFCFSGFSVFHFYDLCA